MDQLGIYGRVGGGGAGGNNTMSYFENMPLLFPGSTTLQNGASTMHILPFILPEAISASFIRVPVSMSHGSTEVAGTSVNTSFSFDRYHTFAACVYSQGTGASSLSLLSVTSSSAGITERHVWTNGAVGSQFTVNCSVTYPREGANDSSFSMVPYGVSSSAYNFSSGSMTLFTGPRFLDIPWANSLSAGNYWIGFGGSNSSASNVGPAGLGAGISFTTIGVSQSNISWGYPGAATNDSIQVQPGLGRFTTNSGLFSTSAIGLDQISAVVSNPKMYFQMIRRA